MSLQYGSIHTRLNHLPVYVFEALDHVQGEKIIKNILTHVPDTPGIRIIGCPTVKFDCANTSTSTLDCLFQVRIDDAHVSAAAFTRLRTNLSALIMAIYKNFFLGGGFCRILPGAIKKSTMLKRNKPIFTVTVTLKEIISVHRVS